ncbi:rhodanese-like domain-containing protein [Halobacillus mangrovi]|uniref:rhodanese-like domain-containing protein n=1 Tax=Halobacillus mangrovi TaxID=402384 RepID=UPI003D987E09
MLLFYIITAIFLPFFAYDAYRKANLKPFRKSSGSLDEFCVIDIRDYISADKCPYPGAENIPLSYLPRALKNRFDCTKQVLLVTDDKRGAKLAAKIIRKHRRRSIYYVQS